MEKHEQKADFKGENFAKSKKNFEKLSWKSWKLVLFPDIFQISDFGLFRVFRAFFGLWQIFGLFGFRAQSLILFGSGFSGFGLKPDPALRFSEIKLIRTGGRFLNVQRMVFKQWLPKYSLLNQILDSNPKSKPWPSFKVSCCVAAGFEFEKPPPSSWKKAVPCHVQGGSKQKDGGAWASRRLSLTRHAATSLEGPHDFGLCTACRPSSKRPPLTAQPLACCRSCLLLVESLTRSSSSLSPSKSLLYWIETTFSRRILLGHPGPFGSSRFLKITCRDFPRLGFKGNLDSFDRPTVRFSFYWLSK